MQKPCSKCVKNHSSYDVFAKSCHWSIVTGKDLPDVHSDARGTRLENPRHDSQGFGYVRNTCSLERSRSPRKRVQMVLERMCELRYRSLFPPQPPPLLRLLVPSRPPARPAAFSVSFSLLLSLCAVYSMKLCSRGKICICVLDVLFV